MPAALPGMCASVWTLLEEARAGSAGRSCAPAGGAFDPTATAIVTSSAQRRRIRPAGLSITLSPQLDCARAYPVPTFMKPGRRPGLGLVVVLVVEARGVRARRRGL